MFKRILLIGLVAGILVPAGLSRAQDGAQTLAATMKVQVFPKEGQSAEQQSKDEAECYTWAVGNTGTDPFELAKQAEQTQAQAQQAQQQVDEAGKGAGAKGAVGGAAAGAVVGKIADDDAGKGAAVGAGVGAVAARRKTKRAKQDASQQIEQQSQQAQAATQEQMTNFKKAFTACLEAKDYIAKY